MAVGAVLLLIVRGLSHRPDCPISGSKWDSLQSDCFGAATRTRLFVLAREGCE
jgi:hypothetical protein